MNMNEMENITKIWVNADGTPATTHYNGSWNVIKHESKDGLDYSITIWESIYYGIECFEENEGREATEEEWLEECAYALEMLTDGFGIELIKVPAGHYVNKNGTILKNNNK